MRARTAAETDWPRIVALYDALRRSRRRRRQLNRAVAVSMAFGPAEGLAIVDGSSQAEARVVSPARRGARRSAREARPRRRSARRVRARGVADAQRRERRLMQARAEACGALVAPAPLA
jgi:predicted RNA polymerase sigma factor